MTLKICLLGSVPKGDEVRKDWVDWKGHYIKALSALKAITFVDGDTWKDETKPLELFGHDCSLIKESDIVIVDVSKKLGAGTAQEMLIAKYFSKPVILVLPKNTHHRRRGVVFNGTLIEEWIHPFLRNTSDLIVEDINEALSWIQKFRGNPSSVDIKDITIIDSAIKDYRRNT